MKLKELIIDRARWLRGEGSSRSFLLRSIDNKMCCLGFLALDAGYDSNDIDGVVCPGRMPYTDAKAKWPNGTFTISGSQSEIIARLMVNNDDAEIAAKEREKLIKFDFRKLGYKVKFVGRTPRKVSSDRIH